MIRSYNFFFDSGIDSIDILLIVSSIGMFTESGIRRRNKAIFSNRKQLFTAVYFCVVNSFPASVMFLLQKALDWNPILETTALDIFRFRRENIQVLIS